MKKKNTTYKELPIIEFFVMVTSSKSKLQAILKSNFLLCRLCFSSDHNFISKEGNLIILFCVRIISLLSGIISSL